MKKALLGLFLLGIGLTTFLYVQQAGPSSQLLHSEIDAADFEVMKNEVEEFFVYFYSPLCPECQEAEPLLAEAVVEAEVILVKINTQKHGEVFSIYMEKHGIPGIPAVLHFVDGEVVGGAAGAPATAEVYRDLLQPGRR